jgi:hypothetical protein
LAIQWLWTLIEILYGDLPSYLSSHLRDYAEDLGPDIQGRSPGALIMRYLSLDELIGFINRPTREEIRRVLHENRPAFEKAQGSRYNHQAWPGGYIDHVTETMNLARVFYQALNEHRGLPFSLSDALIALFFHDIEKPFRHEYVPGDFAGSKDDRKAWFLAEDSS